MKITPRLLYVAALLAALALPTEVFAKKKKRRPAPTPVPVNTNNSGAVFSVISGGFGNLIDSNSPYSVIAGGLSNRVAAGVANAAIGGGVGNAVWTNYSTVAGGINNTNAGFAATIAGGEVNVATNDYATVGGGAGNTAGHLNTTIAGGIHNTASAESATVGGGETNRAIGSWGTVGGGLQNTVGKVGGGSSATVAGGRENAATGDGAAVGGGQANTNNGRWSVIAGGSDNTIGNDAAYSVIPGGNRNSVGTDGIYSFAAGRRAQANHAGCFVWADSTDADFGSASTNQFLVRAKFVGINRTSPMNFTEVFGISSPQTNNYGGMYVRTSGASAKPYYGYSVNGGGNDAWTYVDGGSANKWKLNVGGSDRITVTTNGLVGIGTTAPTTPLQVVNATCNGESWVNSSDRNLKTSFKPVHGGEILRKVAGLPISEWTYKSSTNGSRHVGPTAQDFREAFGLGDNDKTISTIDPSGVALAAIQGLVEELKDRDKAIEVLKSKLQAVEERLNSLPPAP